MEERFSKQNMFAYNRRKKRKFVFYSILVLILIIVIILSYVLYLKDSDLFFVKGVNNFLGHIAYHLSEGTLLGSFYAPIFGGLFFVPVPLELVFLTFLKAGHTPWLLVFIYILGLFIAYTLNYLIGGMLTEVSKKIISYKRFYRSKGFINKYGAWGVFIFNVLPLPSQPLAAILGVFRYNKVKFYVYAISGQIIKYTAIVLGYFYIV
jgi:membrane protein YqaA with SNARE-associated domain